MTISIPKQSVIPTADVQQDPAYGGLRVVRYQTSDGHREAFAANRYQFQQEPERYTPMNAMLCRKGAEKKYRIVATIHPTLLQFISVVRYDPSDPPPDDYDAQGMQEAHERTQSDFKGQKKTNTADFRNYILEGIKGQRALYLPTITGWQSRNAFDSTVFVAFDEGDPNAMYGKLWLPKAPVMQADGQTQTAALFQAAKTVDSRESNALSTLTVALEIELNVDEEAAGQSFADRNGRGSKKNKNLVIDLDTASALSELRRKAMKGTIFEGRLHNGRTGGTSKTATKYILDLSTMEQMLLGVVSSGRLKSEQFKYHYVQYFEPFCHDFLTLLGRQFGANWPDPSPPKSDAYRRLYVHGWPFALKALALAYHQVRIDELAPLTAALGTEREDADARKSVEAKFAAQVELKRIQHKKQSVITVAEFEHRLTAIAWERYRKHWIAITGYARSGDGKKKTFLLKSTGEEKVEALAQNTAVTIETVRKKILSETWKDLCSKEDEPLS